MREDGPEVGQGNPGPEILPQPADELDAALGEALEPADNERNDAAGGGGGFSQEFEAFGAAFEFRGVLDAGVGEGLIVQ